MRSGWLDCGRIRIDMLRLQIYLLRLNQIKLIHLNRIHLLHLNRIELIHQNQIYLLRLNQIYSICLKNDHQTWFESADLILRQ